MKRALTLRTHAVGVMLPALACSPITGPGLEIATFDVASERVECQGVVQQMCYLTRRSADAPWEFFYSEIHGFRFEAGHQYTVRVVIRHVRNPPADGSSLEYALVAVVRKIPTPAPATMRAAPAPAPG